jgi:hypothetical protein
MILPKGSQHPCQCFSQKTSIEFKGVEMINNVNMQTRLYFVCAGACYKFNIAHRVRPIPERSPGLGQASQVLSK